MTFSATLTASGGTAPYTFSISWGKLPAGLSLGTKTGTISGQPTETGTYNFGIHVKDSSDLAIGEAFAITVAKAPAVAVTITPATTTVASGASTQFTALVTNTSNVAVTWSASPGTISSTGLYQAPTVTSNTAATVTATSVADATKSATAAVTVTPPPVSITTTSLLTATAGTAYSSTLSATGGKLPYTWTLSSGSLPSGITVQSAGSISGTTSQTGSFTATIEVTDSSSPKLTSSKSLTLTVNAAVAITITPTTASVASGASTAFTALVSNTSNVAVTWSASPGTVSTSGLYQAPTVTSDTAATVTATSQADTTKSATASVTITPPPVSVTTTSLSSATAGAAYSNTLTAAGGTTPYAWSLSSGTLPTGITVQSSGSLSGTTTKTGTYNISVEVTDSSSPKLTASQSLTLTVAAGTSGGPLPAPMYFGFSESNTESSDWPTVNFGMQRFWDSPPLQWPYLNTASGVFDFTNLDTDLALAYTQGARLGMYTLARTPPWATSNPNDTTCNYSGTGNGNGNGECDPPSDLNSDGSGADAIWKAWITAIATHVNSPGYTATHAHIMYWEIWNEPDTKAFFAGSIAQLARLTEDANCIITGRGVIHENGNGTSVPCTATAIDPTAQIVMASAHAKGAALKYGQNELYCNDSPSTYQLPCPNPANAIATAVDIINFHMKPGNESGNNCPAPTPCTVESAMQWYVANIRGMMQPADLLKPLWDGEAQYSSSGFSGDYLTDTDLAASFMPRFYLINWTLNISGMAWYSASSQAEPAEAQTSYQQTYNWLSGASLTTPCAATGTVWSCGISISGKPYLIMWDTSQTCANGSCSTGSQVVSSEWTKYQDMTTASTPITISGGVVPVGIKPVILN
ncbi:MAG: putative Ig domain-containing protein [Candidatus Sulfotelmatobacter sp.]